MRFVAIMGGVALAALFTVGAGAESATGTVLRICKSEDILMHAKSFKMTPDYLAVICPCIADHVQTKAKPAQAQALADFLKLPVDRRKKAMGAAGKDLSMGMRTFFQGQMICAKKFPPKKH